MVQDTDRGGLHGPLASTLCEMDTITKCHDPSAALLRQGNKTESGHLLGKLRTV